MSTTTHSFDHDPERVVQFLRDYYREDIGELARHYPRERDSLTLDYTVIDTGAPNGVAEKVLYDPVEARDIFRHAVSQVDIPVAVTLDDVTIRFTNLPDGYVYGAGNVREHIDHEFVGVSGRLHRVGEVTTFVKNAYWYCIKCGFDMVLPQPMHGVSKPNNCDCNGAPSFEPVMEKSRTVNMVKVRVKQPPGDAPRGNGEHVDAYLLGDIIDRANGGRGVQSMAGERVTVYGDLKYDVSAMTGRNADPTADRYIRADTVEPVDETIAPGEVDEYKDRFEELAGRDDAPEFFADCIAPDLVGGGRLDQVKLGVVAYLFGSPRIEVQGSTYRGDIHVGLIGDPAVGKSTLMSEVAAISPRCERVSGTMSTGVGLTAATTQNDFDGQWALQPGLLPRANGGHAIVDELDKAPSETTQKLHDALEEQQISVSKAGINATLDTKAGLLAGGNPKHSRIDRHTDFFSQVDIDPALLSRFDLLFLMRDVVDESEDRAKAEHTIDMMSTAARSDSTYDPHDVELDVLRSWVAYAREHVDPVITNDDVKERIAEWYVSTRQESSGERVAATVRKVEAGVRLALAFARCRLSEEVSVRDAELAIQLSKRVMGDFHLDLDSGELNADVFEQAANHTQGSRIDRIMETLENADGTLTPAQVSSKTGIGESRVESDLDSLAEKGRVVRPSTGEYREV